jgi:glucan biosynthesis protein
VRETGLWRLVIEITQPLKAVDLSAYLQHNSEPASERWAFTWQP